MVDHHACEIHSERRYIIVVNVVVVVVNWCITQVAAKALRQAYIT